MLNFVQVGLLLFLLGHPSFIYYAILTESACRASWSMRSYYPPVDRTQIRNLTPILILYDLENFGPARNIEKSESSPHKELGQNHEGYNQVSPSSELA